MTPTETPGCTEIGAVDDGERDLALAGAVQPPPDGAADDDRERDQREVVADPGLHADVQVAEQAVRLGDEVRVRAPDELGDVLEDQEHRVGDEDEQDLVAAVEDP
jgi:hypothetical protein